MWLSDSIFLSSHFHFLQDCFENSWRWMANNLQTSPHLLTTSNFLTNFLQFLSSLHGWKYLSLWRSTRRWLYCRPHWGLVQKTLQVKFNICSFLSISIGFTRYKMYKKFSVLVSIPWLGLKLEKEQEVREGLDAIENNEVFNASPQWLPII